MTDKQRPEKPFSVHDIGALGSELIMAPPESGQTVCLPVVSDERHEDPGRLDCTATGRTQGE